MPGGPSPGSALRKRLASVGVTASSVLTWRSLDVDLVGYEVRLEGQPIRLSALQIELLAVFLAAPERVWHRDELAWLVGTRVARTRNIDVHLSRIRGRAGRDLFLAVPRRGWRLR